MIKSSLAAAVARISHLACHSATCRTVATSEHEGQRVQQTVSASPLQKACGAAQLIKQDAKGYSQVIATAVEGLITGQVRQPDVPMPTHVVMDSPLAKMDFQVSEQIHRYEFLVSKQRAGVIAQALIFQVWAFVVDGPDS